jgi:uncharacterized protein YjbJ (UPF0337 family)
MGAGKIKRGASQQEFAMRVPESKERGCSIMTRTQAEGMWNQVKGTAKANWSKLTDADLNRVAGRKDALIDLLQERYGIGWREAAKQVDGWISIMHTRRRVAG